MKSILNTILFLFFLKELMAPLPARAWRETGHYTVCEIAYRLSSKGTKDVLNRVFEGQPYAVNCTWPDHVRKTKDYGHTYPWHFINIKDGGSYFDKVSPEGDTLQAIYGLQDYLRTHRARILNPKMIPGKFSRELRENLKFLGHFVGDIHQPLHVGRRSDFGGNKIDVKWGGKSKRTFEEYKMVHGGHIDSETKTRPHNLHKVVDQFIPEKYAKQMGLRADETGHAYIAYATHLLDGKARAVPRLSVEQMRKLSDADPYQWVKESLSLRASLYAVEGGEELSGGFYKKNIGLINRRILEAGVRLAGILDGVLEHDKKPSSFEKDIRQRIQKSLK